MMKTKLDIQYKLIINFLVISLLGIIAILVFYVLSLKDHGRSYSFFSYLSISFILYKNIMPYIILLSIYLSFFYSNSYKDIAVPIAIIFVFSSFYLIYDYYLLDIISSKLRANYSSYNYKLFYNHQLEIKHDLYEKARIELANENLNKSYELAKKALIYDNDDANLIILLKSIQQEIDNINDMKFSKELDRINDLLSLGSTEFSRKNYSKALDYFKRVLKLDSSNPLALYYINRISIIQNNKPQYKGNTTDELYTYSILSDIINLYNSNRIWEAYRRISELYINYSNIPEVKNYYNLIVDKINSYDFFIDEASELENVFLSNLKEYDSIMNYQLNGISFLLNTNTLFFAEHSLYYKDSFYLFDVSIINLNKNLKIQKRSNFKYGRIVPTFGNTNNVKNIILKAPYNFNSKKYSYIDTNSTIIPISISASTLSVLKNYTKTTLDYLGLNKLLKLKNELQSFGYSKDNIEQIIVSKIISPVLYLLLYVLVAYFSLKYRIKGSNNSFFISIVGILGTIAITLVYSIAIDYSTVLLLTFSNIFVNIILIYSLSISIILYTLLKISKLNYITNTNDK